MKRETMPTNFGEMSDDLVAEILSRLSVKSLMRFRCVCKSWYSLVEDSNFIYKHLKREDNMRLMVHCTYHDETADDFDDLKSYFSVFADKTLTDLSLHNLEPEMPGLETGPYEGIFCLFQNNTLITLWNVAMNKYRVLPTCSPCLPCETTIHYSNVGFGLDPMTNDFKLVLIFTLWHERRQLFHDFSYIAVYTFSTNSWRDLEGFEMRHDYMYDRIDNIYLNGVCYWLVSRPNYHKAILSFKMSDEVFQEIEGPDGIPQKESYYQSALIPWILGIYDDTLSILNSDMFAHSFDLWMMTGGSWTKHLTFGPFIETYQPIGFWRKDEFILESSNKQMFLYDSKDHEMRNLGVTGLWFSVRILKESLIATKEEGSFFGCS